MTKDKTELFGEEDKDLIIDSPDMLLEWLDEADMEDVTDIYMAEVLSGEAVKWSNKKQLNNLIDAYYKWVMGNTPVMTNEDVKIYKEALLKDVIEKKTKRQAARQIVETNDGYFTVVTKEGGNKQKQITDFTFHNVRTTVTTEGAHITIVNILTKGEWIYNVVLDAVVTTRIGEFRTYMRDRTRGLLDQNITPIEFQGLIGYLDNLPSIKMSTLPYMGYHYTKEGKPYMAYLAKADKSEQKIVKTISPNGIQPPEVHFGSVSEAEVKLNYAESEEQDWKLVTKAILENMPRINDRNKMLTIMSWFLSSPLRHMLDIDQSIDSRFPILSIVGTPGSGKTTVVQLASRMMGYTGDGSSFTKPFTVIKNLAESNAHFHWIDEYKVDTKSTREASNALAGLLRRTYDSGIEERGTSDQRKIVYHLRTPVVVSGESAFSDQAVLERSIQITFSKEDTEQNYKNNPYYKNLKNIRSNGGLNVFARRYHEWLLSNHENWRTWIKEAEDYVFSLDIDLNERSIKSTTWIYLGMLLMKELSKEIGEECILEKDDVSNVLQSIYLSSNSLQKEESLSSLLLNFLSEEWHTGIRPNQENPYPITAIGSDPAIMNFHRDKWVKKFRRHCMSSDVGPQQDNIIYRTLKDLELKGCLISSKKVMQLGKKVDGAVLAGCFQINIERIEELYDIPVNIWREVIEED